MDLEQAIDRYTDFLTVERGLAAHTLESYARDFQRLQAVDKARGIKKVEDSCLACMG